MKKQKPSVYSEQHVKRFGSVARKQLRLAVCNGHLKMLLGDVERHIDDVVRGLQNGEQAWTNLDSRLLRKVCQELGVAPEKYAISEYLRGAPVRKT